MGIIKPLWMREDANINDNWGKTLELLNKTTNQKKLVKIAKKAPVTSIRCEAVKRITDQSILTGIAKTDVNMFVRMAAVEKLNDQILAQEIYKDIYISSVKNNEDSYWRIKLVEKITNPSALLEIIQIAQFLKKWDERNTALNRLNDQNALAFLAKTYIHERLSLFAIKKLTDPNTAQAMYVFVAKNTNNEEIRLAAADKLTDSSLAQTLYAKIAATNANENIRIEAIKKLSNQSILANIVATDRSNIIRKTACECLSDQAMLADIALNADYFDVLRIAIEKLSDKATLNSIAQSDNEKYVKTTKVYSTEEDPALYYSKPDSWLSIYDLREIAARKLAEL